MVIPLLYVLLCAFAYGQTQRLVSPALLFGVRDNFYSPNLIGPGKILSSSLTQQGVQEMTPLLPLPFPLRGGSVLSLLQGGWHSYSPQKSYSHPPNPTLPLS